MTNTGEGRIHRRGAEDAEAEGARRTAKEKATDGARMSADAKGACAQGQTDSLKAGL